MPHKTRRAKMTETAGESRIRSRVPMNPSAREGYGDLEDGRGIRAKKHGSSWQTN